MTGQTVAVIGVGNMGGGMAGSLLDKGWTVRVFDINAAKVLELEAQGALACASAAEAVGGASVVIVCVVDAAQSADVLFGTGGAATAMTTGTAVLLCPTISPGDAESLGARLGAMGLQPIDAPMSGGPARACDGTMSLLVACAEATFVEHAPLLRDLSDKVFHISARVGDGARTKLVNNLLAGINLAGAAEALAMAEAMGLDPAGTLDVIEQSSGQSWIGSDRMRRAIAGDYAPRAHVTLLQKDTRLAVEAARAAGFDGPLGKRTSQVFADASAAGLAGEDDAALFKLLRKPAS